MNIFSKNNNLRAKQSTGLPGFLSGKIAKKMWLADSPGEIWELQNDFLCNVRILLDPHKWLVYVVNELCGANVSCAAGLYIQYNGGLSCLLQSNKPGAQVTDSS